MPSSGDIRAGRAFVEISALDKTKEGLESAERRLMHFGRTIEHFGRSVAALGAAIFAPFALMGRMTQNIGNQIRDAADKAHDSIENAGRTMGFNKEESRNAVEFAEAIEEVETTAKRIAVTVGGALLPELRRFTDWFTENSVMVRGWIKQNSELIVGVVKVGGVLLVAGLALMAFGKIAIGVAHGLKVLSVAFAVFQWLGFLLSPGGLVLLGIAAVGIAIYALTTDTKELADEWETSWGAMKDAVSNGDLEAAFKVLCDHLRFEWTKLVKYWTTTWEDFKKLVGGEQGGEKRPFWKDLGTSFKMMAADMGHLIPWAMATASEAAGIVPAGTAADIGRDWMKHRNALIDESKKNWMNANGGGAEAQKDLDKARDELNEARRRARNPLKLRLPGEYEQMGLAQQAKGLFSSSALSQSLAISDKLGEAIKKGVERAADAGEKTNQLLEELQQKGAVFA